MGLITPDSKRGGELEPSDHIANFKYLDAKSAVPAGGTTGQVLTKKTNADGDVDWESVGAPAAPTFDFASTSSGGLAITSGNKPGILIAVMDGTSHVAISSVDDGYFVVMFQQNTGNQTVTFDATFKMSAVTPDWSTAPNKIDAVIGFVRTGNFYATQWIKGIA
jgi:hypothetical protein